MGLDWVYKNIGSTGRPSVVNVSLGGPASLAVDAAVKTVRSSSAQQNEYMPNTSSSCSQTVFLLSRPLETAIKMLER